MDEAYSGQFTDINVNMPCCGALVSLNDIVFEWPMGFSRFIMQATNPNITDIDSKKIYMLEQILKCPIRVIWAHY